MATAINPFGDGRAAERIFRVSICGLETNVVRTLLKLAALQSHKIRPTCATNLDDILVKGEAKLPLA